METVKSGWFYAKMEILTMDYGHLVIEVWNEELDSNMDAHPVRKAFSITDREFIAIREFVRKNSDRYNVFQIQRTNGGAINVGIEI